MTEHDIAERVAFGFLGKPYFWGGDDPMQGFDCSGFVIEILKSVGKLPRKGDWTAQGLWDLFHANHVSEPRNGCLVFWKTSNGRMIHVEYCLDDTFSIGASGGNLTGSGANTIPFADITAADTGTIPVPDFGATISPFAPGGFSLTDTWTYTYDNTTVYQADTYNGTATYTITVL